MLEAVEEKAAEGTALIQADHGPHDGGGVSIAWRIGRGGCGAKAEFGAGVTRRGFDAQRKTGGGGRPALMASQQVAGGKAVELQDPEVRAELNRHVRECERECSTDARLGSIPQASVRARQQATREQVKSQRCESSTGAVRRRCDRARRSCGRLRGCADRVSAAHAREQWRLSS
jgi:hypothetical protein